MELDKEALEKAARALFPEVIAQVTGRAPRGGFNEALKEDREWMREAAQAAVAAYLTHAKRHVRRRPPRQDRG